MWDSASIGVRAAKSLLVVAQNFEVGRSLMVSLTVCITAVVNVCHRGGLFLSRGNIFCLSVGQVLAEMIATKQCSASQRWLVILMIESCKYAPWVL